MQKINSLSMTNYLLICYIMHKEKVYLCIDDVDNLSNQDLISLRSILIKIQIVHIVMKNIKIHRLCIHLSHIIFLHVWILQRIF